MGPRDRDAAAVAAVLGGPQALRVLADLVRQVEHLGQAELLALVDVGGAGQGEHHQGRRPGTAQAELAVAVPGDVPLDVVVGQHPGRRRADGPDGGERLVDHPAQHPGVPRGLQEVEVEGLMQLVRPHVPGEALLGRRPGLGDADALPVVGVEQAAPAPVDLVDAVLVEVRQHRRAEHLDLAARPDVGKPLRLDHPVGDVDAEAVHAEVEPEAQDRLELRVDLGVLPVQVGLLGGEQVEVPLTVGQPRPRRAAEHRLPVVGRQLPCLAPSRAEDVPLALGAAGARLHGLHEPGVPVGGVVRHHVRNDLHAVPVRVLDQRPGVRQRAEDRVDVPVVGDVVPEVGHRRGVERRQPDGVHAQPGQVVEPAAYPEQVTDAVAVAVGEAAHVDLVDHRVPPPAGAGLDGTGCTDHVGHWDPPILRNIRF